MEKLQHSPQTESKHRGAIVAELVHFVQCVLGQIHAISIQEASRKKPETNKKPRTRSRNLPIDNGYANECARAVCKRLTTVLLAILRQPNISCSSNAQVCEGIICAFLDHLGSSLSLVVFADLEQRSGAGQLGVCPPTGLEDADDLDTELSMKAAAFEAPFLVTVLKQIMSCIKDNSWNVGVMVENDGPSVQGAAGFMRRVRTRLQNTLLRGVFGDNDETFKDALRRADSVDTAEISERPETSKMEEMTCEWFIGQVWTHLGWEVLSQHASDHV